MRADDTQACVPKTNELEDLGQRLEKRAKLLQVDLKDRNYENAMRLTNEIESLVDDIYEILQEELNG